MFVCVCRAVTDHQIREAVDDGVHHVEELEERCGVGTGCGSCKSLAQELIEARLAEGLAEGQAYAA